MNQNLEIQMLDANGQVVDKNGNVNLQNLTPAQTSKYETLAASIEESSPNSVINFGAELQNTLASQSDSFLNNVRRSNSGEVGELINKLLVELNYVDVDELEGGSFKKFLKKIPLLSRMVTTVENVFAKYDKIVTNISDISNKVNAGIINSTKDNAVLQTIFSSNVEAIKKTLAVALHRQQQHIEVQQRVSQTTEVILRKNAQRLQQNSVNVARANEQTIVSMDTLRETTTSLINTLNEVRQIQQQGEQTRRQLDNELQNLETTLKNQLQNRAR